MDRYLLGFDIGGTKCAAILGYDRGVDQPPEIIAKEVFLTKDLPAPEPSINKLLELAGRLTDRHRLTPQHLVAGGVSCGGPLDSVAGIILSPPNLPGWDRVPIVEKLEHALKLPVGLQNDANACALAEWRWGAARHTDTAVFLTFGTGMGAGLIIGGRLHTGKDDLAGEVGHWRMADEGPLGFGKKGSFEGFCSGGGMARLAQQRVRQAWERGESVAFCRDERELAELDVLRLSQAARSGVSLAREIFQTTALHLGQGLALLIDLLNPEVIVIGSIFARCEDLLREPMEKVLAAQALPKALQRCRIVPAELGESIGDYASLAVAQGREQ
jgi:glucokinase